jgi:hypothetical protein
MISISHSELIFKMKIIWTHCTPTERLMTERGQQSLSLYAYLTLRKFCSKPHERQWICSELLELLLTRETSLLVNGSEIPGINCCNFSYD